MRRKEINFIHDGQIVSSRPAQYAGRFHNEKGYELYSFSNMVNARTNFPYPSYLTDGGLGKLMRLSRQVQMDTNALAYKASKGMKPMTHKNVADVLNLKAEEGYRFVKRMKDIGIIKEVNAAVIGGREKWLVVNPIYFMAGEYVSDELYWTFERELNTILSERVRSQYEFRRDYL